MKLIKTSEIEVFPSARRVVTNVSSRLLSEKSLVGITNHLIDMDGFIITKPELITDSGDNLITSKPIEFNIFGYYFRVNKISDLIEAIGTLQGTKLYASIEVVRSGDFVEIYGQDEEQDDGSFYKGLIVSTNIPEAQHGGDIHTLALFERPSPTGDNWGLAYDSYFKFVKESVDFDIDGGEVK